MIKLDIITGDITENKQKFIERLYGGEKGVYIFPANPSCGECDAECVNCAVFDNYIKLAVAAERVVVNYAPNGKTGDILRVTRPCGDIDENLIIGYVEKDAYLTDEGLTNVTRDADAVVLSGFFGDERIEAIEKIKEFNPRVTVILSEDIKNGKTLITNLEDGKRILNLFSADIKNLFNDKR